MNFNWKVLVTIVLMVGAIVWTVNSIRSTSYSGANLNFDIGRATVTVTNPSNESIPVQLVAPSNRSFSVSSTIADVPRTSVRAGETPNIIHVIEFELPPGESEFTVTRGSDVSFVADTTTRLEATVQATGTGTKTKLLAAFLAAALFYMSFTTKHRWLYTLLGRQPESKLHAEPYAGERDTEIRSYGDNRAK